MPTCPECKQPYSSRVNTTARRPTRGLACCLACRAVHIAPGGAA